MAAAMVWIAKGESEQTLPSLTGICDTMLATETTEKQLQ
jgi:hypothetical protein